MRLRPIENTRALSTVVAILQTIVVVTAVTAAATVASGSWVDQVYTSGPPDNPLKGFVPYAGRHAQFPHSLEWSYIAWKDIQTGYDTFTWTTLDAFLSDVSSRGHQAVFRIYADYPNKPYAVPAFLSDVPKRSYTDFLNGVDARSYAPDYDNPNLVRAMTSTIRALGRRYDRDPRIGFITVGFIGFWGEWHMYRRDSCACDTWMPTAATETAVLNAFDEAFNTTKVLVRYPDVGWSGQAVGFHDDSFADQTVDPPSWTFLGRLKRAEATHQWRTQPIGGELYPPVQLCTFTAAPCNQVNQDFDSSLEATHASWLMNHHAFAPGYTGAYYSRAVPAARRLGYDLFVSAVRTSDTTTKGKVSVAVRIQNKGVAPFYYDWPVRLGVANAAHQVVATYNTGWRLTKVIERGADVEFAHGEKTHGLPPGRYTLLMRAVNPLPNGRPLVFANATWARDVAGWLTLGSFSVGE